MYEDSFIHRLYTIPVLKKNDLIFKVYCYSPSANNTHSNNENFTLHLSPAVYEARISFEVRRENWTRSSKLLFVIISLKLKKLPQNSPY